ncbi:MAG: nucleotide exchange factor GrpE [Candidatus Izemoplasmataceae bacterium]
MSKKKKTEEVHEEETKETVEQTEDILEEHEELKEPTLEDVIADLKEEIQDLKTKLLREHADLENTRKRLEKERILERKYAALNVVKELITPMDHFELALQVEPKDDKEKNFLQGFTMIKKEFAKALEEAGVSEIDALDEEFDPNYHQAIATEKVEDKESNIVLQVLQKGYMYKDRLIRPAIVKISE